MEVKNRQREMVKSKTTLMNKIQEGVEAMIA